MMGYFNGNISRQMNRHQPENVHVTVVAMCLDFLLRNQQHAVAATHQRRNLLHLNKIEKKIPLSHASIKAKKIFCPTRNFFGLEAITILRARINLV